MIPAEAVEVAAKKLAGARHGLWELTPEPKRRLYLRDARLALEAAAPILMAAAWDRAAASIVDEHGDPVIPINVDNPYRSEA